MALGIYLVVIVNVNRHNHRPTSQNWQQLKQNTNSRAAALDYEIKCQTSVQCSVGQVKFKVPPKNL